MPDAFDLDEAVALLARTPALLDTLLRGLPASWTGCRDAPDAWSAFDVVGHLLHGERTDWIPRIRIILEHGAARAFDPFDRFAQERESVGKSLDDLLDAFAAARGAAITALGGLQLGPADLDRPGAHPALGPVTLRQLLATWVVHDLNHLAQIARTLAGRYGDEVGPWQAYLPLLGDRERRRSSGAA